MLVTLTTNQHFLVEAGRSTGKSLAYLLPSLFFAKNIKHQLLLVHTQFNYSNSFWIVI
ncbi:hypothetical protein KHA80_01220 [Anaerobacillus sp. HL2]|nr:hypothetical protein KHA80_01220 [Anaerobacillus sp. HL2]